MREYTRLLDPTRPSTMANAGGWEMVKGLDVVGINYIVQNDVDNRKKYNPTWKFVGTEETSGCGTRGIYFNDPDSCHMPSINPHRDGRRKKSEEQNDGRYYEIIRIW